ncbi:MAG TPA: TolC family outer membrane protein [Burkholderiaceae bacterium]
MRKPFIAVLIASAFLSINAQAVDLIQVYQQALTNDSQYASARAQLAAGQERLPQGRANLLPVVNLSGANTRTDPTTPPGPQFSSHSYEVRLTQPVFRWANWQAYEQSKLAVAIAEAQFAQAQQDVVLRVAQAYFDVLAAQDVLAFTQAQKTATTEQLASAKRNFEVGTQTITDTNEAQAAYDLVVAQEFQAMNTLEIRRTALQQIIGQEPGALAPLKPGVSLAPPVPAKMDEWVAAAERQNYNVQASQLNLESAKREISRNRAGHLPTLDLVATSGRSAAATKSNGVSLQYTVPLFAGFGVSSRVREAIALEDKARADLETTRRSATQTARQSFLSVNSGLAQVRALEAAETSSLSSLESNKLGYQVGVRINIDVLNAQRQLFSTRRDLAQARYETIMNGLRLKSAAGALKESDLEPVNALLAK